MIFDSNANWRNWFLFLIVYLPWIHDQAALFILNFNINTWEWMENGWNFFSFQLFILISMQHMEDKTRSAIMEFHFFFWYVLNLFTPFSEEQHDILSKISQIDLYGEKPRFAKIHWFEVHKQNTNCKFNLHQDSIEWSASSFCCQLK